MAGAVKYLEVAGMLERQVALMEAQAFLPPEQQLANAFGVSKPTMRRALQQLVDQGRLRKVNGVGVMVVRPTKTISRELIFLCHDIRFFAESINCFGNAALASNYFVSIVPLVGDALTQERIVHSVIERRPAGVVLYADPAQNDLGAFYQLGAAGIQTLHLIRLPRGIDGSLLEIGNAEGIVAIIEHFHREGRRAIAFYGNEVVNPAAAVEREAGFRAGMKKFRLKVRPGWLCARTATRAQREAFLRQFDREATRPDAVCCMNDHCAGQLIKALLRRKVPVDAIRFSGFDHTPLSEFIPQSILTVDPPMEDLGREAAAMLIRQVENPNFGFQRKKLKTAVFKTH